MKLIIKIKGGSQYTLVGFPFRGEDQYLESETETELTVELGDYTDTTILQEQFLNTNDGVVWYAIM